MLSILRFIFTCLIEENKSTTSDKRKIATCVSPTCLQINLPKLICSGVIPQEGKGGWINVLVL